ncbi:hypothetical protein ACLKA7_008583 [Drosophila subpalustris]
MRKNCSDKQKLNNRVHWVDPGVPTLPEAEQLIASLMPASWPDWPISACVGCHVSPPPFYKKKLAGHHFNFSARRHWTIAAGNGWIKQPLQTPSRSLQSLVPTGTRQCCAVGFPLCCRLTCSPALVQTELLLPTLMDCGGSSETPLVELSRHRLGEKAKEKLRFARQGYVHYDSLGDIHPTSINIKSRLPLCSSNVGPKTLIGI